MKGALCLLIAALVVVIAAEEQGEQSERCEFFNGRRSCLHLSPELFDEISHAPYQPAVIPAGTPGVQLFFTGTPEGDAVSVYDEEGMVVSVVSDWYAGEDICLSGYNCVTGSDDYTICRPGPESGGCATFVFGRYSLSYGVSYSLCAVESAANATWNPANACPLGRIIHNWESGPQFSCIPTPCVYQPLPLSGRLFLSQDGEDALNFDVLDRSSFELDPSLTNKEPGDSEYILAQYQRLNQKHPLYVPNPDESIVREARKEYLVIGELKGGLEEHSLWFDKYVGAIGANGLKLASQNELDTWCHHQSHLLGATFYHKMGILDAVSFCGYSCNGGCWAGAAVEDIKHKLESGDINADNWKEQVMEDCTEQFQAVIQYQQENVGPLVKPLAHECFHNAGHAWIEVTDSVETSLAKCQELADAGELASAQECAYATFMGKRVKMDSNDLGNCKLEIAQGFQDTCVLAGVHDLLREADYDLDTLVDWCMTYPFENQEKFAGAEGAKKISLSCVEAIGVFLSTPTSPDGGLGCVSHFETSEYRTACMRSFASQAQRWRATAIEDICLPFPLDSVEHDLCLTPLES